MHSFVNPLLCRLNLNWISRSTAPAITAVILVRRANYIERVCALEIHLLLLDLAAANLVLLVVDLELSVLHQERPQLCLRIERVIANAVLLTVDAGGHAQAVQHTLVGHVLGVEGLLAVRCLCVNICRVRLHELHGQHVLLEAFRETLVELSLRYGSGNAPHNGAILLPLANFNFA